MRVTKKIVTSCKFFFTTSRVHVTRSTAKKNARRDDFFLHVFTEKKNYTASHFFACVRRKKKLHNVTFFLHTFTAKKEYTT